MRFVPTKAAAATMCGDRRRDPRRRHHRRRRLPRRSMGACRRNHGRRPRTGRSDVHPIWLRQLSRPEARPRCARNGRTAARRIAVRAIIAGKLSNTPDHLQQWISRPAGRHSGNRDARPRCRRPRRPRYDCLPLHARGIRIHQMSLTVAAMVRRLVAATASKAQFDHHGQSFEEASRTGGERGCITRVSAC